MGVTERAVLEINGDDDIVEILRLGDPRTELRVGIYRFFDEGYECHRYIFKPIPTCLSSSASSNGERTLLKIKQSYCDGVLSHQSREELAVSCRARCSNLYIIINKY
jgi:hypothetical protein